MRITPLAVPFAGAISSLSHAVIPSTYHILRRIVMRTGRLLVPHMAGLG